MAFSLGTDRYVKEDIMLPLKIETLLEGKVVEQDRIEYKEGWNPNDVRPFVHYSVCNTFVTVDWVEPQKMPYIRAFFNDTILQEITKR